MAEIANSSHGSDTTFHPCDRSVTPGAPRGSRPKVLVCSDIRLLRDGITLALGQAGLLHVVGAVEIEGCLDMVARQRPDVVLLDAGIASGRELPRLLKQVRPDVRVVVVALADGEAEIVGWAEAGVSGYVGRDGTADDLTAAVEGALRGEALCSPKLVGLLFARVAELSEIAVPGQAARVLTRREREIMALMEQRLTNKEIARRLGIGHATVKNHVHHILEKVRVSGRAELAVRMSQPGQAGPDPSPNSERALTA
jgi:two-component system nitrate/nitrite response regulator NarL